jgi:hypothetical protein
MSKLDKLISKFFDNLRQNRVDAFTKDIMSDPKGRAAVKRLKQSEKDLLSTIKNKHLLKK